jgi:phospholipase C
MGAMHFLGYEQQTIYNEFDRRGISWAIYAGDIPQSVLFEQLWPRLDHFHFLSSFYRHAARDERDFPQFAFIEPRYYPPHQSDDHPPNDVVRAQELLASVYNAIRANDGLWKSTLLVVLYDEHGGFFDHISPPPAVSPDGLNEEGCDFLRLGVRVPAVFVSPWIKPAPFGTATGGVHFDHTSLIKYLCDKVGWQIEPLKNRVLEAADFASYVQWTDEPRTDCPPAIIMPARAEFRRAAVAPLPQPEELNEHQEGLAAFMEYMGRDGPSKLKAEARAPGDPCADHRYSQGAYP